MQNSITDTKTSPLFKLLNSVIVSFSLLFTVPLYSQMNDVCEEVLLLLRTEKMGSTDVPAYVCNNRDVYLSLTDVFKFLNIKSNVSDDFSKIEGFFIHPENNYEIDIQKKLFKYKDKVIQLGVNDFKKTQTAFYLKTTFITRIFDIDINFNYRALIVSIKYKEEFPKEKEIRLEKLRVNNKIVRNIFSADTTIYREKPSFHFGNVSWSFNGIQNTNGYKNNFFSFGFGALVMGGELNTLFNVSSKEKPTMRNQYYNWRFVNTNSNLIKQISIGKISKNSISTIYFPVVGVQLTNTPLHLRESYETYQINDFTGPEWVVEVYMNDVLINYKKADITGYYSFDIPLSYGINTVTIRTFGPFGEENILHKYFNIPYNFLPVKKFEYNLGMGMVEDSQNSRFFNMRVNYGIAKRITIGGGIEYLSSLRENEVLPFGNASVGLAPNMYVSGEYVYNVGFTNNFSYSVPSVFRLDLNYKNLEKGQTAIRRNYLEERLATLIIPMSYKAFNGTSRFMLRQNVFDAYTYNYMEYLLSGRFKQINFNLKTFGFFNKQEEPTIFSNLSSNIRLPRNWIFIPWLQYEYTLGQVNSLRGEIRKQLFKNGYFNISYETNYKYNQQYLQVGARYDFSFSRVGFAVYSSHLNTSFNQYAMGGLTFDDKGDVLSFDNISTIGRASVKFIAFLDRNNNGKREPDESGVQNLVVLSKGGGVRKQLQDGSTIYTALEPYYTYYFEYSTEKLDMINWFIKTKSVAIELNPNQVKVVEIPVEIVGEIAGYVYMKDKKTGMGLIKVNIFDKNNKPLITVLTEPDGYFGYLGLKKGQYTIQVDSLQLKQLGAVCNTVAKITIDTMGEGTFIDNLEFYLENPKTNTSVKGSATVSTLKNEKNITFKVQILASDTKLPENDLRFRNRKDTEYYIHDGRFKYTLGAFGLLNEAVMLQKSLRKQGFKDAFVVAFLNGERITIEEAGKILSEKSKL